MMLVGSDIRYMIPSKAVSRRFVFKKRSLSNVLRCTLAGFWSCWPIQNNHLKEHDTTLNAGPTSLDLPHSKKRCKSNSFKKRATNFSKLHYLFTKKNPLQETLSLDPEQFQGSTSMLASNNIEGLEDLGDHQKHLLPASKTNSIKEEIQQSVLQNGPSGPSSSRCKHNQVGITQVNTIVHNENGLEHHSQPHRELASKDDFNNAIQKLAEAKTSWETQYFSVNPNTMPTALKSKVQRLYQSAETIIKTSEEEKNNMQRPDALQPSIEDVSKLKKHTEALLTHTALSILYNREFAIYERVSNIRQRLGQVRARIDQIREERSRMHHPSIRNRRDLRARG